MAWFAVAAILAICILTGSAAGTKPPTHNRHATKHTEVSPHAHLSRDKVIGAISVLIMLDLLEVLLPRQPHQLLHLLSHQPLPRLRPRLAGAPLPLPRRRRRRNPHRRPHRRPLSAASYVIWCSILGVLPFTLILPHANLFWTAILTVIIGFILASAFSAILVYAQELVPGRVGMISGLFFGFAFGMGGIGAAVLGRIADATSIIHVYQLCAYLPAIGLLTWFLPKLDQPKKHDVRK